jgi:Flp pilus assembly protein TadG
MNSRDAKRAPHRQAGRAGAASVEFAIVAPLFLFLVFGIFEFARAIMVTELLTEAARKSCRVAVVQGSSSQQIKSAAIDSLSLLQVSGESVGISVNNAPLDSVDPQNVPPFTLMTVVVSVPASKVCWLPAPLFENGVLSGRFAMRRQ